MTKPDSIDHLINNERDRFPNLGHDLRGYLFALDSMLEDIPELGKDGSAADGVGMMLRRMNDIAEELMHAGRAEPANNLKQKG